MADKIRVLYVDDEKILLDLGKIFLERSGDFLVETIDSAFGALKLLQQKQFDAIISDYQMPDMDGIEFLKTVRVSENNIPFILFTGRGREEVVIQAINSGADFYLQKGGEPGAQFAELSHKVRIAVEQRTIDLALKESEKNLSHAQRMANMGSYIWNIQTNNKITFSDQMYEIFDFSKGSDISTDLFMGRVHPFDRSSIKSVVEDIISNKVHHQSFNFRIVKENGENRFIEVNCETNFDSEGKPVVSFGTAQDTTERRLAEESVHQSKERYRQVVENAGEAIVVVQENRLVFANPKTLEILGITSEKILNRPFTDYIHPDDRELVALRYHSNIQGEEISDSYDFRLISETGDIIQVHISSVRIIWEKKPATLNFLIDITDRKEAETKIRDLGIYTRSLIEASLDPLVTISPEGNITDVNAATELVTGYSRDHLIGASFLDFFTDPGKAREGYMKVFLEGSVRDYPLEIQHRDGTITSVLYNATVYHDESGTVKGVFAAARDISGRKKAEMALQHQSTVLSILNTIISSANRADNLPDLLKIILAESLHLLDFDAGGIYLVDPRAKTAKLVHYKNIPPEILTDIQTVEIDKKPYDTLFIQKEPIITDNYAQFSPDRSKKTGFHSMASIPLIAKGVAIGALNIASMRRYVISPEETQVLISIGRELGSTIERMTAEEQAKSISKNFETLFNSIDEMVFVLDMQGRILTVNDSVEKRLLYSPGELTGLDVRELHVPERRDEALRNVSGMIAGTINSCPVPLLAKDGTIIEVETKVTRGGWNNQEVLIGVSRDVTAKLRAEESKEESEERYRAIYDESPIAIELYDSNGVLIHVNPACMKLFGTENISSIQNFSVFSESNINDEEKGKLQQGRTARYQGPFDFEKVKNLNLYQTSRSGTVWLDVLITPLGNRPHLFKGFLVQIQDITDTRLAEKERKRHAGLIRSLIDSIPDIIFYKDINGVYLGCNPQFARFVGRKREEIIGKTDYELFTKEIADFFRSQDNIMLELGESRHNEEWITYPDGQKILIDTLKTPYWGPGGTLIGVLGISRDITEKKVAEEALSKANKKLNLLSSITRHDINNQLTVLVGYHNLLQRKYPDNSNNEYFRKVVTATERIIAMVKFTKEYEDVGVNAPLWQDAGTIVDNVVNESLLGQVTVKNDIPHGLMVLADPLIVKVCYNLVDNAVQYGEKITTIKFFVKMQPDDLLFICEDDGRGIPVDEKEKIFKRGYGKNTGLGLALAREILDITGISIEEKGEPGRGALFEIKFPKGTYRMNSGNGIEV